MAHIQSGKKFQRLNFCTPQKVLLNQVPGACGPLVRIEIVQDLVQIIGSYSDSLVAGGVTLISPELKNYAGAQRFMLVVVQRKSPSGQHLGSQ